VRRRDRAGRCVGGLLALTLLGAALAGCDRSSTEAQPQGATVPTAAPTTTTTDPYAVPAVIDIAYVNRVLAGLDAIQGDVLRAVKASGAISPDTIERVRAFHTNLQAAELLINLYQFEMARAFSNHHSLPGNAVSKVDVILTVRVSCIYAQVDRDTSALVMRQNPRESAAVGCPPAYGPNRPESDGMGLRI
jgi:hypothetical protein